MNGAEDQFARALLDPRQPVPDGLHDGAGHPAGRRFDVHRNNIAASLTGALIAGFPVTTRLIGEGNMRRLAGKFRRAHPPSDPVMTRYGAGFPEFLARTEQLAHLGYLPDVARLELAIRAAYHAGDATPIAHNRLAEVPAQALAQVTFAFAPPVRILRSDWPIFDIWQFNTRDDAPKPQPGAQDVLITRPEFDPAVRLLPPGGACWIDALMRGASIGAALEQAQHTAPDFDMTAPLALLLRDGALISLTDKG